MLGGSKTLARVFAIAPPSTAHSSVLCFCLSVSLFSLLLLLLLFVIIVYFLLLLLFRLFNSGSLLQLMVIFGKGVAHIKKARHTNLGANYATFKTVRDEATALIRSSKQHFYNR